MNLLTVKQDLNVIIMIMILILMKIIFNNLQDDEYNDLEVYSRVIDDGVDYDNLYKKQYCHNNFINIFR